MDATTVPVLDCPISAPRPNALGMLRVATDDGNMALLVTFDHFTLEDGDAVDLPLPATVLTAGRYSITGGERRFPRILAAEPVIANDRAVRLTLDQIGDFSVYTLTFSDPLVDPHFASRRFRFRLDCDDPFDCREPGPPPPIEPEIPVSIDYLAKDYAGFRQALLDFIASRHPTWTERSEADIGILLLELLAAQADWLSYYQDRVANEAFLATASTRRSVGGHLELLGYQLDEGAAAWTWLHFTVTPPAAGNRIVSFPPKVKVTTTPKPTDPSVVDPRHTLQEVIVFETLSDATLHSNHNQLALYDWGLADCCLPADATSAALVGDLPALRTGHALAFVDALGHRDVVRLVDEPTILPVDPIRGSPTSPLTVVRWSADTPLSSVYCAATTRVLGNLVLATHGESIESREPVGQLEAVRDLTPEEVIDVQREIDARTPWQRVPRQRLPLQLAPVTHIDPVTLDMLGGDAPDPNTPRPSQSTLELTVGGVTWQQRASLLEAQPDDEVYRVEIENDGTATIVFGDDCYGAAPDELADIFAAYRVGLGTIGNVGPDTLVEIDTLRWGGVKAVTNPLPATGGRDPETRDHARRYGPELFKTPLVAVTAADYEAAAKGLLDRPAHHPIQRAHAEFRWTGSWLTITLAIDPVDSEILEPGLRRRLLDFLEGRRLAGYDLEVIGARYVPVELDVELCIRPGFRPDAVIHEVKLALSDEVQASGARGFFHADDFTFGDPVVVSKLYRTVQAVPGVESAHISRLARVGSARPDVDTERHRRLGMLPVASDEIVRLDDDRNHRERGVLTVRERGSGA